MTASSLAHRSSSLLPLRIARGLTRDRLAALAGVSSRSIYSIEREGVRPHRTTARALAEVLGCDPDELRTGLTIAPDVDLSSQRTRLGLSEDASDEAISKAIAAEAPA